MVRQAYFFAQDKDRKLYFETERNPLWGQLNSEGKTAKGKRKRFSIDNDREDTSEDEDFCPKAKRADRPPSPLHVRPKLPRMLREQRKSPVLPVVLIVMMVMHQTKKCHIRRYLSSNAFNERISQWAVLSSSAIPLI